MTYLSSRVPPSSAAALTKPHTAQSRAAAWMATSDPRQLPVTDQANFLQRYALVCFYYGTGMWNHPLNFLTDNHECDWNAPLLYYDGSLLQLGVNCSNSQTKIVDSITIHAVEMTGTIPIEVALLTSLTTLELDYNSLTGFPALDEGGLMALTQLKVLSLSRNRFSDVIPTWLGQLTMLSTIILSFNGFEENIPTQLAKLTKLTTLALDSNQLHGSLDALSTMTLLRHLKADTNKFTELPNALAALDELEYFNIAYNNIAQTLPTWIGQLTTL
jgi:Leucine-rich repeat (LRR) protein